MRESTHCCLKSGLCSSWRADCSPFIKGGNGGICSEQRREWKNYIALPQKPLAPLARGCRLSSVTGHGFVGVITGRDVRPRGGTAMGEAWIIDAVRTPRGKGRKDVGALVQTHPQELMATTLRALA